MKIDKPALKGRKLQEQQSNNNKPTANDIEFQNNPKKVNLKHRYLSDYGVSFNQKFLYIDQCKLGIFFWTKKNLDNLSMIIKKKKIGHLYKHFWQTW